MWIVGGWRGGGGLGTDLGAMVNCVVTEDRGVYMILSHRSGNQRTKQKKRERLYVHTRVGAGAVTPVVAPLRCGREVPSQSSGVS